MVSNAGNYSFHTGKLQFPCQETIAETPSAKERGNNHARRKEYVDMEVQEHYLDRDDR